MFDLSQWLPGGAMPVLLLFGLLIVLALVTGRILDKFSIPFIVTYMLMGFLFGPSFLNLLTEDLLANLHFLTDAILGFVAFKIGLELSLNSLQEKRWGVIFTILMEAFLAVAVVALLLYLVTGDWPLSILLGALAPASAPAGTVAVIEEYGTKGPLTRTLYAVVGFDDALGVIIFGVALAISKNMIAQGSESQAYMASLVSPLREIGLSLVLGGILAFLFMQLARFTKNKLALTFGFVLLGVGGSVYWELSEIFTCIVMGMAIGNNKSHQPLRAIEEEEIGIILPLFFILFFALAGANLHVDALGHFGLLGVIYIAGRSGGKLSGAYLGASIGGFQRSVRNYLGFGILSQAGIAIGLALMLKQRLSGIGPVVNEAESLTRGDQIGQIIFTTITVTTFVFELLGPIATKFALKKAGEVPES